MNPTDLNNALLYGIPVVLYASMYQNFDSILARLGNTHIESSDGRIGDADSAELGEAALHVSVARSVQQFAAARDLVRKRYAWRGYDVPEREVDAGGEITFLVSSKTAALGTLTLGLDGPRGLRAEATYSDVIERFRAAEHRVCELTRLAIAEGADTKKVLASLFSLAHAVGRTSHDVSHVFIEVNPRHVPFYSRVLGFIVEASGKVCERVHAPSTLLQVEIEALEKRLGLVDIAGLMQPLAEAA
jgi:N-acyl amino acid synthase FeeM